jgi:hypothetical protein
MQEKLYRKNDKSEICNPKSLIYTEINYFQANDCDARLVKVKWWNDW